MVNNSAKKEMRQTKVLGENINYNNASAAKVKMNSDSKYNRSDYKEPSLPKLNLIVISTKLICFRLSRRELLKALALKLLQMD